jgi:outer membrane murein-binding lipoprotein Lpp
MYKKSFMFIISSIVLSLFFVNTTFAASSTFLAKATDYYNKNCKTNITSISRQVGFECYLFDKVGEVSTALTQLTTRVTGVEQVNTAQNNKIQTLEASVQTLESKIQQLENKLPKAINPDTQPKMLFTFIQNTVSDTDVLAIGEIRNEGSINATVEDMVFGDIVQNVSASFTPNTRGSTSFNITNSQLRQGLLQNPKMIINYRDVSGNHYRTTYTIELRLGGDGKYLIDSLTNGSFVIL